LEFGVLVFVEEGKLESLENNPRVKEKTNNSPTHIWPRLELKTSHIGGRRGLSPLYHHCAILGPHKTLHNIDYIQEK